METPDWLPWVLMAPILIVLVIGIPTMIVDIVRHLARYGCDWADAAYVVACVAMVVSGAAGYSMVEYQLEGRDDAEQETTIQRQQGQDSQAVRAESQRQPPRVRRAVAEVPGSLPGQAPTVRGVHSQREDSSSHSDRPHQGGKRAKRSAVLGGD